MNTWHQINTTYENIKQVNKSPPIYVCDNLLTDQECDTLIKSAEHNLEDSHVVKLINGKEILEKDSARLSKSFYLSNNNNTSLINKISNLVNKDSQYFEDLQVGYYQKGGFYKSHHDALDIHTKLGNSFIKTRGQRIITVLMYLNDVKKGGRTYFKNLNIRFIPKKGTALIFFPAFLNREIDEKALHCAEKVIDEKWVAQLWIRDRFQ
jgi:prolyl 4-hydroxylase